MYHLNFDLDKFLTSYWHKKPTIIKQGFSSFIDPITPDEVAGLAMEEEIDSRFVSCLDGNWEVKHGPFGDFSDFPDSHSQLIVQAANHWHAGLRQLASPFQSLPQWLFDDVMVCLSMPNGGVGPHIDQYDVFIIQGMGKRRWRVGERGKYRDANHHTGLRQIDGFEPIIDDILEPGDILYIPPGFPHEGNTIDVSLSYSVGFRSPNQRELLSGFADHVINNELGEQHFHNPELKSTTTFGCISANDFEHINSMLMSLVSDENAKKIWMGEQLSQSRHELDIMPADPPWQMDELQQFIQDGLSLEKVSGLRVLFHEDEPSRVFINGEAIILPDECASITPLLANQSILSKDLLGDAINNPDFVALLLQFCNQGLWYPKA